MELADGAPDEAIARLREAWPHPMPDDYLDTLRWSDGLEGAVAGRGYLRLWSADAAVHFNHAYHLAELIPGVFLFGGDAAGLGYGFDGDVAERPVVSVELSGLHRRFTRTMARSFTDFLGLLASESLPPGVHEPLDHRPPEWLKGYVVHHTQPIVLGGPPADPSNRVLVLQDKHPEVAVFWSRVVHHHCNGGTD